MIKKHVFFSIKYTLKQNWPACRQKKILQFQSNKSYFTPSLYERCLKNSLPLWMISMWKINENEECLAWWIVTAPFTSNKLWQFSSKKIWTKDWQQFFYTSVAEKRYSINPIHIKKTLQRHFSFFTAQNQTDLLHNTGARVNSSLLAAMR